MKRYKGFIILNVYTHFEVRTQSMDFLFSADTFEEAEREIDLMAA